MHLRRVAHRDLKLENVIVTNEDKIKIIDFGWSVIVPSGKFRKSFSGTVSCMAPEILFRQKYSIEVDIWSFGIMLFESIFNKPLFLGSAESVRKDIQSFNFDIDSLDFDLDSSLKDLLKGCLEIDSSKRFSIEEIMNHSFFKKLDN